MAHDSDGGLQISQDVAIPEREIELSAVRAQGPGGQNVNKVANAVSLRFDIGASSLPVFYKERLLRLHDRRISKAGVVVIKAQRFRSLEQNRDEALRRLRTLVKGAGAARKARTPTTPSRASRDQRLDRKTRRGREKALRAKPHPDDP